MTLQAGQKVRWLDEKRSGAVESVRPDGRVDVTDTDGMLWSGLAPGQLVAVGKVKVPAPAPVTDTQSHERDKVPPSAQPDVLNGEPVRRPSIALCVANPAQVLGHRMTLWAINPGVLNMYLVISVNDGDEHQLIWNGEVASNSRIDLRSFTGQDLGYLTEMRAEALFFHPLGYKPAPPVCITVRLGGTRLMRPRAFNQVAGLDNPAMLFALENEVVRNKTTERIPEPRIAAGRKDTLAALSRPEPRIDLHLEKIPGDHSRLTGHEKLMMQTHLCQQHIATAISQNFLSIVFIHGMGNGRLKQQVYHMASLHQVRCETLPNGGETRVYLT